MKPRLNVAYLVLSAILKFPLYLSTGIVDEAKVLATEQPPQNTLWYFIGCVKSVELAINSSEDKDQSVPKTPRECVQNCHQFGNDLACLTSSGLCHCWTRNRRDNVWDRLLRKLLASSSSSSSSKDERYFGPNGDDKAEDDASKCFESDRAGFQSVQVYRVSTWEVEKLELRGPEQPVDVGEVVPFKIQIWLTTSSDEPPQETSGSKSDDLKEDGTPGFTRAYAVAATTTAAAAAAEFSPGGELESPPLSFSCLFQSSDGLASLSSSRIAPAHSFRRRLSSERDSNSGSQERHPYRNRNATERPFVSDSSRSRDHSATPTSQGEEGAASVKNDLDDFSSRHHRQRRPAPALNKVTRRIECSANLTFSKDGVYAVDSSLWSRGSGTTGRFGWKESLPSRKVTARLVPLFPRDILLTARPKRRNDEKATPKCVPTLPRFAPGGIPDQETIRLYSGIPYDLVATLKTPRARTASRVQWSLDIDPETEEGVLKNGSKPQRATRKELFSTDSGPSRINRGTNGTHRLEYVFEKEAVYTLQLNVTNFNQNVARTFILIVIDHRVENLRFALSPNSSDRLKPNVDVEFILTLEVTDPNDATVSINFGDGSICNETLSNLLHGSVNRSVLISSDYGQNCRFRSKLRHRYQSEGIYQPTIMVSFTIDNRLKILEGNLREPIKLSVCESLEGTVISGNHMVPAGTNTSFTLSTNRDSNCPKTVRWFCKQKIYIKEELLYRKIDHASVWAISLNETGNYVVEANIDNVVSSTSAIYRFKVIEPVSNVALSFKPGLQNGCVKIWDTIRVIGSSRGSEVVCTWNIYDSDGRKSPEAIDEVINCTVKITFDKFGDYRVCLEVRNDYNHDELCQQLTVQEEIKVLELFTDVIGGKVKVYGAVDVRQPSGVQIVARLSYGRDKKLILMNDTKFSIDLELPTSTSLNLTVSARNNVSQAEVYRTIATSKETIPNFQIKSLGCVIKGRQSFLEVSFNDDELSRGKMTYVYKWSVSGYGRTVTSLPFYSFVPTSEDVLNVRVSVIIDDNEKRNRTNIKVESENNSGLCVWNQPVTQPGTNVTFNILKPPGNVTGLFISLINLTSGETIVESELPVTEKRVEKWIAVLYSPGLVYVRVRCFSATKGQLNQSSLSLVRGPVNPVLIHGPQRILLSRIPVRENWTAVTSSSAGLLFKWRLDDQPEVLQASANFSASFISSGNHSLRVKVRDGFDAGQTWISSTRLITVTREFPADLKLEYVRQGRSDWGKFNFTLTIEGGSPRFVVHFKFGDGTNRKLVSETSPLVAQAEEHPRFVTKTYHHYRRHGLYHVAANVSYPDAGNRWISRDARLLVREEPVGDGRAAIRFDIRSPSLVALFQNVVVVASIPGETTVIPKIDWDFGDGTEGKFTKIETVGNDCKATHSYGKWGNYTVKASFKSDGRRRMVLVKPSIVVVEPIQRLKISSKQRAIIPSENVTFEVQFGWGSDVTFNVSFDDDTFIIEKPQINPFPVTRSIFTHTYVKEGVYRPSVLAINPLGSVRAYLNQELKVQSPPTDLKLQNYFVTKKNRPVELWAKISSGTNVSYDWFLDDSFWKTTTGSKVNQTFPRTGMYRVAVEAYNDVTDLGVDGRANRPRVETIVYVLNILRHVAICLIREDHSETCEEADEIVLPLDEKIVFKAQVHPDNEKILQVTWKIGNVLKNSGSTRLEHKFKDTGRYSINVTVHNIVSKVSSGLLKIRLIQRLQNLTNIKHDGTVLIGEIAVFRALFWHGSDLRFSWDFGDGSEVEEGTSVGQHTFPETGEYFVTVTAWNQFSRANLTTNVFVLDKPCRKPVLEIIEQCRNQEIHSSDPLQIEIDLTVTCQGRSPVTFYWSIVDVNNHPMVLPESMASKRNLYLNPEFLQPGTYKVAIKVSIPDTIVYAEVFTEVKVQTQSLEARIDGGLSRRVGKLDEVVFDARKSRFPSGNVTDTKFMWSCRPLRIQLASCFVRDYDFKSADKLTILAKDFNLADNSYLISLSVTSNTTTSTTSTVLQISNEEMNLLKVQVSGMNYDSNEISYSLPVKIEAKCGGCEGTEYYEWEIWLVEDGLHYLEPDVYDCAYSEGTAHNLIENEIQPTIYESHNSNNSTDDHLDILLPQFPNFTLFSEYNATKSKRDTRSKVKTTNDKSNGRKTTAYSINSYPVEDFPYDLSKTQDYQFSPHLNVTEEGSPGEGGSARAREHADIDRPLDKAGDGSGDKKPDPRNEVRDETIEPETEPHILHRPRIPLDLYRNETRTGINSKYLLIKEGVLKPFRTYVVSVNVRSSDSVGTAMDYFKVVPGPGNGRCSVAPVEGVALETTFRLHCLEWKSEKRPLTYIIQYSMDTNGPRYPLYSGLNPNAKFYLPSGSENRNYTLTLHLAIKDGFGSKTDVCSIDTRVVKSISSRNNFILDDRFVKLTREWNVQGILGYLLIVAQNLSSHHSLVKDGLKLLKEVKPDTPFEAVQCLTILTTLIKNQQVTADQLELATKLVNDSVPILSNYFRNLEVYVPILSTISSILNSTTISDSSQDWRLQETYYYTRKQLLELMDNLSNFKSLLFDEDPVELSIPEVGLSYGYLRTSKSPIRMNVGPVKLTYLNLNENKTRELPIAVNKYFNLNIYGSYSGLPVKQVVVSTIITYDESNPEFTAEFPRNFMDTENVRVLRNGFINVHRFNLTSELGNESLTITIHLLNEVENPLVVMLGLSSDIGPRAQLVTKTLTRGFDSLNLFIPAGVIKHESRPHVIIAPAKYANGEVDSQTTEPVKYRLTVSSQVCLIRDEDSWTTNEDCLVLDKTNDVGVTCRCVASYPLGLVTWSPALLFSEEAVEDILGSYYNPTALVAFSFVIFLSFILLRKTFCLDQRNAEHCLLNELKDNKPWDSYYYFVSIRTGPFLEAGTTASVYLVLHGDKGYSSAKCLSTSVTFQRSSRDNFFFGVEKCLGKIWKAQVWHNNVGTSPSWYLQDITIVDLLNGEQYRFNCEKWLSVEEEDGLIEREILAEETDPPFSKIFRETLSYVLPNHHLWSSVFSAPSWSVFNHTQRLTCCLSTIFASSALCALGTDYLRLSSAKIVAGIPWRGLALAGAVSIVSFIFHSQLISATRHARYRRPSLFVRCRAPLVDCLWCSWWWCWLRAKRTSQRGSGRSSSPSILMDEIMDSDSEYREGTMTETESDRSEDFEEGIELAEYPKRNYRYHSSGPSLHLRFSSDGTRERNANSEITSQISGQTSSGFEDWLPESQGDTSPVLDRISDKDNDQKRLPRYFLYVSWMALVIVIVSSAILSLREVNRFDTIGVFFWLSSWCFAIIFDIVFWQPLMVLVISFVASVTAYRAKENWTMDCWSKALKLATKKAKEMRIHVETSHFSKPRGLTYNRPPSEYDLILARQKAARFRATSFFIKNTLWSIFILVFLSILIIGDAPSDYFELRQSISSYVERFLGNEFKTNSDWNNWYLTNFSKFMGEFPNFTNCEIVGVARNTIKNAINVSTIEFLLLNPPTNLFCYVSLKVFFPSAVPSLSFDLRVSVARLKETESSDLFFYFLEVIFVGITFWLLKLETWRFFKKRVTYWKDVSNILKILFCICGCAYFATLIYQSYASECIFVGLKNGKLENLVDIRPLAFCDWLRRSLRGLLLFIHILKCFEFLKFHPIFEKFVKAIVSVWKQLVLLMFFWCFFLIGVVLVRKLTLGADDGNRVTSVINVINTKRERLGNHRSILASIFYAISISITFFAFGFIRSALVTALKISKKTLTKRVISKNVAKNLIGRILCRKRLNSLSKIETTKLPLEFLLFELDTLVNELIEKANKLFTTSESDLRVEMEENIRDIMSDFDRCKSYSYSKPFRIKSKESLSEIDYPFSTMARPVATLNPPNESRAIYKVRKTYPIQISNSLDRGSGSSSSSSSSFSQEFKERDSIANIRKTKSKGKGKNGILQMALENLTNSSQS